MPLLTHRDKVALVARGKRCKLILDNLMLVGIKWVTISLSLCNLRLGTTTYS